jgi:hypothetical protein
MTDTPSVDRSEYAAMRAEMDRLKQIVLRGAQTVQAPAGIDQMAAADFRRMTGPDLDVVPRSAPLGYLEGASWEAKQRMKLEAVAKSFGGRRDADQVIPSVYSNDWTPVEEHRWEFALGLRSDVPDEPLDRPEKPGTGLSAHEQTTDDVRGHRGRRPAS